MEPSQIVGNLAGAEVIMLPQIEDLADTSGAVAPALTALHDILEDPKHPQLMKAIHEVLERNQFCAIGVEPPYVRAAPSAAVNTQVHTEFNPNAGAMSDAELDRFDRVLEELKWLQAGVVEGETA